MIVFYYSRYFNGNRRVRVDLIGLTVALSSDESYTSTLLLLFTRSFSDSSISLISIIILSINRSFLLLFINDDLAFLPFLFFFLV